MEKVEVRMNLDPRFSDKTFIRESFLDYHAYKDNDKTPGCFGVCKCLFKKISRIFNKKKPRFKKKTQLSEPLITVNKRDKKRDLIKFPQITTETSYVISFDQIMEELASTNKKIITAIGSFEFNSVEDLNLLIDVFEWIKEGKQRIDEFMDTKRYSHTKNQYSILSFNRGKYSNMMEFLEYKIKKNWEKLIGLLNQELELGDMKEAQRHQKFLKKYQVKYGLNEPDSILSKKSF